MQRVLHYPGSSLRRTLRSDIGLRGNACRLGGRLVRRSPAAKCLTSKTMVLRRSVGWHSGHGVRDGCDQQFWRKGLSQIGGTAHLDRCGLDRVVVDCRDNMTGKVGSAVVNRPRNSRSDMPGRWMSSTTQAAQLSGSRSSVTSRLEARSCMRIHHRLQVSWFSWHPKSAPNLWSLGMWTGSTPPVGFWRRYTVAPGAKHSSPTILKLSRQPDHERRVLSEA